MEINEFQFQGWTLRKVTDDLRVEDFNCDDSLMNKYFRLESKKYRKHLLVQSYHFCPIEYTESEPIMLVDLCNDTIRRTWIPDSEKRTETKRRDVEFFPAVKIARLGRNRKFRGNDLTTHLMNALKVLFTQNNPAGCRFLTLDAYGKRVSLYRTCGFSPTLDSEEAGDCGITSMFFDLIPFDPNA